MHHRLDGLARARSLRVARAVLYFNVAVLVSRLISYLAGYLDRQTEHHSGLIPLPPPTVKREPAATGRVHQLAPAPDVKALSVVDLEGAEFGQLFGERIVHRRSLRLARNHEARRAPASRQSALDGRRRFRL